MLHYIDTVRYGYIHIPNTTNHQPSRAKEENMSILIQLDIDQTLHVFGDRQKCGAGTLNKPSECVMKEQ